MNHFCYHEDHQKLLKLDFIPWSELKNCTVFITGATGLIGSSLIHLLLYANEELQLNMKIIGYVRNIDKAKTKFQNYEKETNLSFIEGSVEAIPPIELHIDYIIHGASSTSSISFIKEPVEIIHTSVLGTYNLLELAKLKKVKGFIYLSSMEVYGHPATDDKVNEEHNTNLNPMQVRNSYPESKRLCECLCSSYYSEYKIPTKVVRLTQTFGPGVYYHDNRVFAQFARSVLENKNIELATKGDTKRSYLYTVDAVSAILLTLLKGKSGEAYNAANSWTYCSILNMAHMLATRLADNNIKVIVNPSKEDTGYAPTLHMNLDITKLEQLGWAPIFNDQNALYWMFDRMIKSLSKESI